MHRIVPAFLLLGMALAPAQEMSRGFVFFPVPSQEGAGWLDVKTFDRDREMYSARMLGLNTDGFHTVRVFLSTEVGAPGSLGRAATDTSLSNDVLDSLAGFIQMARFNGLGVVICPGPFPQIATYTREVDPKGVERFGANAAYLDPGAVKAQRQYLFDLTRALQDRECDSFVVDLAHAGEFERRPPLFDQQGALQAPNGNTYQLPGEESKMVGELALWWVNEVGKGVREGHSNARIRLSLPVTKGPWHKGKDGSTWQPWPADLLIQADLDALGLQLSASSQSELDGILAGLGWRRLKPAARERGRQLVVSAFALGKEAVPDAGRAARWTGRLADLFETQGFAEALFWSFPDDGGTAYWGASGSGRGIYEAFQLGN